jgi:hypothetical protein
MRYSVNRLPLQAQLVPIQQRMLDALTNLQRTVRRSMSCLHELRPGVLSSSLHFVMYVCASMRTQIVHTCIGNYRHCATLISCAWMSTSHSRIASNRLERHLARKGCCRSTLVQTSALPALGLRTKHASSVHTNAPWHRQSFCPMLYALLTDSQ